MVRKEEITIRYTEWRICLRRPWFARNQAQIGRIAKEVSEIEHNARVQKKFLRTERGKYRECHRRISSMP